MKYSSKVDIPVWFTGKQDGIFAGWIHKDIDGWFKFYPDNNLAFFPQDLTVITQELDKLNVNGGT